MRRLFFITAAFTMLLPAGLAAEPRDGWYPDFDEAVAVAKKSSKDLLIDFTGSDWCVWCIRLKQEVFDQKEFQSEAPKSFVLVSLDFPNSAEAKAKVPNPARNQELAAKYGIEGYPTILLMTAGGAVYGQTGYREGGAVPYLAHLDQLRKNGKQALDVVNGFAGSTGKARTAVMRQAIDLLLWLESGSATGKLLAPIARNAALSKKGAPEYELKAEALKALFHSGNSDAELQAAAREVDPKNTTGLLERAVLARCGQVKRVEDLDGALRDIEDLVARGPIKDTDTASQLYANAAWWYSKYVKKPDKAKTYAKKLQAIAKDDARFASVLDEVLGKNR